MYHHSTESPSYQQFLQEYIYDRNPNEASTQSLGGFEQSLSLDHIFNSDNTNNNINKSDNHDDFLNEMEMDDAFKDSFYPKHNQELDFDYELQNQRPHDNFFDDPFQAGKGAITNMDKGGDNRDLDALEHNHLSSLNIDLDAHTISELEDNDIKNLTITKLLNQGLDQYNIVSDKDLEELELHSDNESAGGGSIAQSHNESQAQTLFPWVPTHGAHNLMQFNAAEMEQLEEQPIDDNQKHQTKILKEQVEKLSKTCNALQNDLDAANERCKEQQQAYTLLEHEKQVSILQLKKNLLGEKEQLLLELRNEMRIEMEKITNENSKDMERLEVEIKEEKRKAEQLELKNKEENKKLQNALAESLVKVQELEDGNNIILDSKNIMQRKLETTLLEFASLKNEFKQAELQNALLKSQVESDTQKEDDDDGTVAADDEDIILRISNQNKDLEKKLFQKTLDIDDFEKELVVLLSKVVEFPWNGVAERNGILQSLEVLVNHTQRQSTTISTLESRLPSSLKEFFTNFPELAKQMDEFYKEKLENTMNVMKKEYIKRYDVSVSQLTTQFVQNSMKTSLGRGRSLKQTDTNQQLQAMKDKYLSTLKAMKKQLEMTTSAAFQNMEHEWQKRKGELDADWKKRLKSALRSCVNDNRLEALLLKELLL